MIIAGPAGVCQGRWTQLLRKTVDDSDPIASELKELIKEFKVQMMGPIQQELLYGIKNKNQFALLKEHLRSLSDLEIVTSAHPEIGQFGRDQGVRKILPQAYG